MPEITDATLLKALRAGGLATHGIGRWTAGRPRSVHGRLVPCERGIHYCRGPQVLGWLSDELWLFEDLSPGETIDHGDKLVTRRGRITARVETWSASSARLFAADCAERVLPIFEAARPGDDRPRAVVAAARAFARGEIGKRELTAASDAAWAAALDAASAASAASAAAWAAASAAAGDAAGDAARVAAWDAASAAAGDAARVAAWDAASAAAGDAARDAASAAARDAAGDAERDWQWARLKQYLNGEVDA